jgi:hypothetical protein
MCEEYDRIHAAALNDAELGAEVGKSLPGLRSLGQRCKHMHLVLPVAQVIWPHSRLMALQLGIHRSVNHF